MPYDNDQEEIIRTFNNNFREVMVSIVQVFIYLFGSSLAMVISYYNNHSILWAIMHGLLTWGYVIYYAIFK